MKPSTNEQRVKTSTWCFRCGDEGHMKKDCLKCTYCLKTGHSGKNCRRRIRDAKGKYCENCKLSDSHNTYECRKRDKRTTYDWIQIVNKQFEDSADEESEDSDNDENPQSGKILTDSAMDE